MVFVRDIVPSMFHRRLMLLGAVMLMSVGGLGAQLARLSIAEGERWEREAESVLSQSELLPTVRGRILDREGRALAVDQPRDNVMVDYRVLSGAWAYRHARRDAYRANADRWGKLSFEQREQLIRKTRSKYDAQVERLKEELIRVGGVTREKLERRWSAILRRVQTIRADVWDRKARRRAAERTGPVELSEVAIRIREEVRPHVILPNVDDRVARYFRKRDAPVLPGLSVQPAKQRVYPWRERQVRVDMAQMPPPLREEGMREFAIAGVANHVVGRMRDVWAEDVDPSRGGRPYRRPDGSIDLGGYLPGDRIGSRGIEAAAERRLRGKRGRITRHRITKAERVTEPEHGPDVRITLDIRLQARIQALLDPRVGLTKVQPWHQNKDLPPGTPLNASVTVLDVQTAEVLAMVSSPASARPAPDPQALPAWPDPADNPAINRPIGAIYPPGSTLKPIVYALAAGRGAIAPGQVVACEGHYLPNRPTIYRCWIFKNYHTTHGPLDPVEAIARSCNIYFYACGDRLGAERLVEGLGNLGFGRSAELGLPGESPGILPRLAGGNAPGRALSRGNAIQMGIGQGPIAVTPMQVAAAHAALSRDGVYRSPILIPGRADKQRIASLEIGAPIIERALDGMYASANEDFGTGHHITYDRAGRQPILTVDDVICHAKTGTAQAPIQFDDANGNGRLDEGEPVIRKGAHAWYVCHAQKPGDRRPRYVIVTLVEYGGSGGRVAGPVTNQVLRVLKEEGYL